MAAKVAMVMPVYNALRYVEAAVDSLLTQTYRDLAVVAVDDGSTDGSGELLDELARRHGMIHLVHQKNGGIVAALNRCLEEALARVPGAEFVGIMNADDISLPGRVERQVAYFAAHPEVDICGAGMREFYDPGGSPPTVNGVVQTPCERHYPPDPRFTGPFLLFWCCFAHPTMMFRRRVLEDSADGAGLRYDTKSPYCCEDYILWAKASERCRMGNIPEVLLNYRLHPKQNTTANLERLAVLTKQVRRGLIERLGVAPSEAEMTLHQRLAESQLETTEEFVHGTRAWLEKLSQANRARQIYDLEAFPKVLGGRWAAVCVHAARGGWEGVWEVFWECPLAAFVDRTLEKNRTIPDP